MLFDEELSIPTLNLQLQLSHLIEWQDHWLNPRRLRGSDFLMRWSQGVWSEQRLLGAINTTDEFWAMGYGPSGIAPKDDIRAYELYFERLEKAGLDKIKRPDLLVFKKQDQPTIEQFVKVLGGLHELPFTPEDQPIMQNILSHAILAIECENSLWIAEKMPDYGVQLRPMKRLNGQLGLTKNAIVPTVILKEEDRQRLFDWQVQTKVDIHLWHAFYDLAFGIALSEIENLLQQNLIQPTIQTFQAPSGATSKKTIYKVYYHYAYPLAKSLEPPHMSADFIQDANGHILPYVRFEGGTLILQEEAVAVLQEYANAR